MASSPVSKSQVEDDDKHSDSKHAAATATDVSPDQQQQQQQQQQQMSPAAPCPPRGGDEDKKENVEAYTTLVQLFETIHIDNMKILKALVSTKDDVPPLLDGKDNKWVGVEVLRRKNVLLLISDLNISMFELDFLESTVYRQDRRRDDQDQATSPESQFEVMWLPVVDGVAPRNEANQLQREIDHLQSRMVWYSVHHPSSIDPGVIKYIKEKWHFDKKPILVALDPQGRVVNPNAFHMFWIWIGNAFPFTSMREEALWKGQTWTFEFLFSLTIVPVMTNWIEQEHLLCLYGGEDIDWIRKFTTAGKRVAQAARISFEMIYMGKSNAKEGLERNINIINTEELSHCWSFAIYFWFFWNRLESMWYSKMQLGMTIEDDCIMQEIMTLLTFNDSEQGWALICKGSANMTKAMGNIMLNCFQQYDLWKEYVDTKGFIKAVNDHLQQLHTPHRCTHPLLPATVGRIPGMVVCTDCNEPMEKLVMYRCSTD